jgi:hypothetical protein
MRATHVLFALSASTVLVATTAASQQARQNVALARVADTASAAVPADTTKAAPNKTFQLRNIEIQHVRPNDRRGITVFEAPKDDEVPFTGFKLSAGAAFTQQYQGLSHENAATPVIKKDAAGKDYNANELVKIGDGFNNADANAYLDVQLAKGIRVALTSYLSARHHNETWVKDGYLLIDASPIDHPILNMVFALTTVRAGHFEINYGDAHFRRTDNGNSLFNPFVGNLIMDAFTTEIGGEVYLRAGGMMAMYGTTTGESKGMVRTPEKRGFTQLVKLGYDKQLTSDVRVRLTGSRYFAPKATNNTLYSGDRGGSRYYSVLDNAQNSETSSAWTGNLQPGLGKSVTAMVLNPFVKVRGLELFGNIEQAEGRSWTDKADRKWTQNAGDVVYRFLGDQLYVAGRYNVVKGELSGVSQDVTVKRSQFGGGWFITPNLLTKVEYVNQKYLDFPATDIRSKGQFKGFMVEGVVAF